MVDNNNKKMAMPSAAKIIEEKNLNISDIEGTGVDGRVTKGDVLLYLKKSNISKNSVIQNSNNEIHFIVEPNIAEHNVYKISDYQTAIRDADIIVFLVAHDEFNNVNCHDKIILDFCGINDNN